MHAGTSLNTERNVDSGRICFVVAAAVQAIPEQRHAARMHTCPVGGIVSRICYISGDRRRTGDDNNNAQDKEDPACESTDWFMQNFPFPRNLISAHSFGALLHSLPHQRCADLRNASPQHYELLQFFSGGLYLCRNCFCLPYIRRSEKQY